MINLTEMFSIIGLVEFISYLAGCFRDVTIRKINQNMNIGHDIQMEHAFNTFLNAKSIGDHFRCFHNVTLGQKNGKTPTIGNNVVVSCGASILGDCIIGDNVIIGAGCVVVKSVPANSTIIGNPAVIVKKEGIKTYELL